MPTSCLLFIPSKPISLHCNKQFTPPRVWYLDSVILSSLFHKHLNINVFFFVSSLSSKMYSKCIRYVMSSLYFLPLLLSSCACCAVSVDLWYKSQGPLLTAHLYLYCRDTAHGDRAREWRPCGHEQKEGEIERGRELVEESERKRGDRGREKEMMCTAIK